MQERRLSYDPGLWWVSIDQKWRSKTEVRVGVEWIIKVADNKAQNHSCRLNSYSARQSSNSQLASYNTQIEPNKYYYLTLFGYIFHSLGCIFNAPTSPATLHWLSQLYTSNISLWQKIYSMPHSTSLPLLVLIPSDLLCIEHFLLFQTYNCPESLSSSIFQEEQKILQMLIRSSNWREKKVTIQADNWTNVLMKDHQLETLFIHQAACFTLLLNAEV